MSTAQQANIRWTAVKLFLATPLLFAIPAIALVILSTGVNGAASLLLQVSVALTAIGYVSYLLAPAFARWCRHTVAAGPAFGVLVCAVGALAFGLAAAVDEPHFTLQDSVVKPLGWIAVCGFPFAALTGLFFAGAAQRLTQGGADD